MPNAQNPDPTNTGAAPPTDADATAAGTNRPTNSEFSLGAPAVPGEVGVLGPYRIVKELGKGGMGAVYLAVDTRLDRELALKVMLP
jgi:serine/threonine protein kinase